ncbi:MAG: ABC transporter ATP-binding protein [Ruminococcaceae bacterium]|nr:ABC transporter ATP-binding protein [Oscillospiraceae bacterium]
MKLVIKYLKPFGLSLLIGFCIKVSGTLAELALPYILSHMLDVVVPEHAPTGDLTLVFVWGGVMILCAVAALVLNIIANRMAARVAKNAAQKVRHDLFAKTMRLSPRQTDRIGIPELETRLTSDTYNIHHFLGMIQRIGVRAPILLIGGIAVSYFLDWRLATVMVCLLPFIGLSVFYISRRGVPLYAASQKAGDDMVRVVREDIGGIRVIKALSKKEYERARFDTVNRALVKSEKKASLTMALTNPLITILLNAGLVAVVLVGAFLVNDGLSQSGKIIAFIQYFTLISNAMIVINRIFIMSTKCIASANRIETVMNAPFELEPEDGGLPLPTSDHIVFENVSFSYNGEQNDLENISFSLPRGGTLGIIGATGSGKSTLLRLLLRNYDPQKGKIYINGKNVRGMRHEELCAMFGTAMQNDFVYADTVRENICFGREVSEQDLALALRVAQAEEFVSAFPEGVEHELTSKGTNVSGGQRQRLLIARALAGKPEILILDDASSALDYKTDAALRRDLRTHFAETTTVVVAQRVSSVMHADLILVLDEGKIIGKGNHEQLLETCSVYREIRDSQMGGALLE